MKNKLQYAYSISVFVGVLLTAYMMMNQGSGPLGPNRNFQNGSYRSEAQAGDPAVSKLLEMENALAKVPSSKPREKDDSRVPSEVDIAK